MAASLLAAGIYNLLWGAFAVFFPEAVFQWAGMELPRYPQLWQCIGMIVGVYGVGYLVAAYDPLRHWPIVLVGLMGKVFGPVGFVQAAAAGQMPWNFGWTIVTNDLVWWAPFGAILYRAYRDYVAEAHLSGVDLRNVAERYRSQHGESLVDLLVNDAALLVFLRHFGCTFCREALADLRVRREEIERKGCRIVLVHMSEEDEDTDTFLAGYGMADVPRISDPERQLYRAFGLTRGRLPQLFGWRVWWRGLKAGLLDGHGIGRIAGDGFQMPGAFYLQQGDIEKAFVHRSAADRPDYIELMNCEARNASMKSELDRAAAIQHSLLPKALPDILGLSLAWKLTPGQELAGDTLNAIPLDDEHVGLYVLDVSGHGVSSALLSVTLNHFMAADPRKSDLLVRQTHAGLEIVPPAEVARRLNDQFPQDLQTGQYFTLVYAVINTRTNELRYVAAGHPGPIHLTQDAFPHVAETTGPPVGIVPDAIFREGTMQLSPGDRIFMYSDGLLEMMNESEELFGQERIVEQLVAAADVSLDSGIDRLLAAAQKWGERSPHVDDVSVLAAEVGENPVLADASRDTEDLEWAPG